MDELSLKQRRAEIISRYARMRGKRPMPLFCVPSQAELSAGVNKAGWAGDGKIIYPDLEAALGAGRELMALKRTGVKLYAYPCPRSKRGHYHLTTRSKPAFTPSSGRHVQVR